MPCAWHPYATDYCVVLVGRPFPHPPAADARGSGVDQQKLVWTPGKEKPRRDIPGGAVWMCCLLFAFGPDRVDGGLALLVRVGGLVRLLLECQQHFRELAVRRGPLARVLRVVLHER